jgi:NADPH:quinone reductase-like Zn-dependent oxidoreductase
MAINHREADFVAAVKEATAGRGVDVVLDMVGGDYLPRDVRALAPDGRLVMIAHQKGAEVAMNFAIVMVKRLTITGSTLRPQSVEAKARIAEALRREVWPLLDAGRIAPVIAETFPLDQAAEAHARLESGAVAGKIILEVA